MRSILFVSAACLPALAHAATFQSFDVPGAAGTCGAGIASNGLVAGDTAVPLAVADASRTQTQGVTPFLYAAGRFFYPHAGLPAGLVTFAGVNSHRVVVGNDFDNSLSMPGSFGFVLRHGTASTPSAGTLSVSGLAGISDRGVLLGQATITRQLGGGFTWPYSFAFLRDASGAVTEIDDGSGFMTPRGMDARAGQVVGYSFVSGPTGWVFKGGAFTPVNYPGAALTMPAGVDEAGTVSGTYLVGDLSVAGKTVGHGFFLRHGTYTRYDVPVRGATSTYIQAMNEAEQITGCFTDATGEHGFIETP